MASDVAGVRLQRSDQPGGEPAEWTGAGRDGRLTAMRGLLPLIYVIVGAIVAQQHHYFAHLNTFSQVISAVLAIVLWPLILLQVNLHVQVK